jgi:hypothetical protein
MLVPLFALPPESAPESLWRVTTVRRSGAFLQQGRACSDEELIEQISGRKAFNSMSYYPHAGPQIAPSWRYSSDELDHFLNDVQPRQAGLRWWLASSASLLTTLSG